MKYLYWVYILVLVVYRRVPLGLIFLIIPFRAKLRNIVYNYHLQNDIILKRLYERSPKKTKYGWLLHNNHDVVNGIVNKTKVTKIKYYISLFFWLHLDDDSMADTYDAGFNNTIINKERKKWMPEFIVNKLKKASEDAKNADNECKGNSFDLGDRRGMLPLYEFWSTFWWTVRNPSYNFNYKFNQLTDPKKAFKIVLFGKLFGWREDGVLNGVQTYSWECGKKVD